MNRFLANCVVCAVVISLSSVAHAAAYGKFCGYWWGQFVDGDGGDYPIPLVTSASSFKASYAWYQIDEDTTLIATGNLDSTGCVTIPIKGMKTYRFDIMPSATVQGNNGPVTIHSQKPSQETFEGGLVLQVYTGTFQTGSLNDGQTYSFTWKPTTLTADMRVMPAFSQALSRVKDGKIAFPATKTTRVSTNTTLCPGTSSDGTNICLHGQNTFAVSHKSQILVEYGHVVSDGLNPVSYAGDTGDYAAETINHSLTDGICDSTITRPGNAGITHNLDSREFIGDATGEGFPDFIATAITNDRNSTANEGEFVYYWNVMKSTANGDNPITGTGECNDPNQPLVCVQPHVPVLSDPTNTTGNRAVKWMEHECNPATVAGPGNFQHFGTEWDWLNFYGSIALVVGN